MSIPAFTGRDSCMEERVSCRSHGSFSRTVCGWGDGEDPPHCHVMWSAIIRSLWDFCGRECGFYSMIRGFFFCKSKERKETKT